MSGESEANGSNTQVCREYLRGECDRGSNCKFSHPDLKEGSNEMKDKICRDYLRDECSRGDRCIFQHPPGLQGSKRVIKFCHNFQNGRCPREGCTYLHCTQEEEEYYNKTGKLPPGAEEQIKSEQAKKVCKDFLNGKCFRSQCKFAHPGSDGYGYGGPPRKRPMPPWEDRNAFYPPVREDRERVRSLMRLVNDLEDENVVLRHKLSRIHRQVLDLTDDNKALLDENRRLRGDPEAPRAPPHRAEAASGDLDSYLRDRPVAVPAPHAPALDPVTSRAAARNTGFESERAAPYSSDRPGYESRLSSGYDYKMGCSYGVNCKFDHPEWARGLSLLPKICGQYRHERDGEKCPDQDCKYLHFTDEEHQAYIKDRIIPARFDLKLNRDNNQLVQYSSDEEPDHANNARPKNRAREDGGRNQRDSRRHRSGSPKRERSPKRVRSRSPVRSSSRSAKREESPEDDAKRLQKLKHTIKDLKKELDNLWKDNKHLQRQLSDHKRFHETDQELINDLMRTRNKLEDDIGRLNAEKIDMTKQISDLFSDNKVVVEENQRLRGLLQAQESRLPSTQTATPVAQSTFQDPFSTSSSSSSMFQQSSWNYTYGRPSLVICSAECRVRAASRCHLCSKPAAFEQQQEAASSLKRQQQPLRHVQLIRKYLPQGYGHILTLSLLDHIKYVSFHLSSLPLILDKQFSQMSTGEKDYSDDICRDYTRGVCNRGRNCKYKHPEELEGVESKGNHKYAFCHDYQNRECVRPNCRFLHCSRAEEDYYKETGKLPPHLEEKVARGYGITGAESSGFDEVPICRDYQKGECNRGSKCKFRHMSRGDMEYEERRRMRSRYPPGGYGEFEYDRLRRRPLEDRFGYLDFETGRGSGDEFGARMAIRERVRSSNRDTRELEEENQILLRKVEVMRKQISDLTAANEVLLEQNARLRASKSENTNNAVMQAETHLVRSTTGVPLLSQGSVAVIQKSAGTPGASGVTAINLIGQQEGGLGDRSQATLIASEMQTIPVSVSLQQEFQPVSLASVMTTQPTMPMQSVPTSILTYPIVSHNIHTAMGR
ncbi:uncharacterized protein LOC110979315 [Acanthaster planci]|uniref:Uncharacterized protein LOC110979315 n=1 Tax=Acanthaster planci TaxID=133434 RepID=A0A8B7YBR8_ACAPL|nr:uncharacterized protein LOC110979315 [Acanthaster planci]